MPPTGAGEKKSEPMVGLFDSKNNEDFKRTEADEGVIDTNFLADDKDMEEPTDSIIMNKRADTFYGNINRGNVDSRLENDIDEETLRRANEILARKDEIDIYEQPFSTVRITEEGSHDDFSYIDDNTPIGVSNQMNSDDIEFRKEYGDETGYNEQDSNADKKSGRNDALLSSDGEKTLVTASGKVIFSDTSAVQKKFEEQRADSQKGRIKTEIENKKTVKRPYVCPGTYLLKKSNNANQILSDSEYRQTAITLQETLASFDVNVTVENISVGPSVTLYELKPDQGVKVSKVLSLANDIKLALAASDSGKIRYRYRGSE